MFKRNTIRGHLIMTLVDVAAKAYPPSPAAQPKGWQDVNGVIIRSGDRVTDLYDGDFGLVIKRCADPDDANSAHLVVRWDGYAGAWNQDGEELIIVGHDDSWQPDRNDEAEPVEDDEPTTSDTWVQP